MKDCAAWSVCPAGCGTLDERCESLTRVQTGKALSFPVVLCGGSYWAGLVRWIQARVLEEGLISRGDMDLIPISDSADELVDLAVGPASAGA